jgi:radical SAM protein with 4Fe4S-binding SPASM domain
MPNFCACNSEIRDDGVYILNPYFRIQNETDHVVVYGCQDLGYWRFHRSFGVVLALCNGQRTVVDIARLTRPLVPLGDDEQALVLANQNVKKILYRASRTKEELEGLPPSQGDFPASTIVLLKSEFDVKFKDVCVPNVEYDARSFLPKDITQVAHPPFHVAHGVSPTSLTWHLTSDCATNCKYCYLKRRNVTPMPIKRTLELLDEAADIGVCNVDCAGGDVLCYPNLFDVLERMQQHKFLPFLLSTKAFITEDIAKKLSLYQDIIWRLQYSIDTDDEMIANYLVGVPDFPNRAFVSIKNALDVGLSVSAKAVITPYNVLTVPRLYRKLKSIGVQKINLATYSRSGYYHTDGLFCNKESFQWLQDEIDKLKQEFPGDNIILQNGAPTFEGTSPESRKESWEKRIFCPAGHSSMMICADGKVIPCEQMPETDEYFCGDVSYQSITEVWNSDRLKDMTYGVSREKFKGTECYDCAEREECHCIKGYCIRDLSLFFGNIFQPPLNCYKCSLPFVRQT